MCYKYCEKCKGVGVVDYGFVYKGNFPDIEEVYHGEDICEHCEGSGIEDVA